ncbi:MAG TPA: tryptophan synthase subunit alpha [Candidatus Saccharimonadales bacterium]|nr:tryptophan synthase subunit alpha [Candidatus Saccharimonadales bacterium]
MCHVVAGYPSQEECVELLLGMQKAGVSTIEVQIPFSDPIADGETIMIANDKALDSGMTTKKSFDLINKARKSGLKTDIYIMSYVQKLISFGIEDFCAQAKSAGVKGLIIPDLPIEAEEYEMLRKSSEKNGLEIVPVVSPTSNKARLKSNLKSAKDLVYLTSIKGITGNKLKLGELLKKTAKDIKKQSPNTKLAIGFGIDSKKDVEEIMRIADMAVIGSSVIRRINKGGVKESLKFVRSLI